MMPQTNSQCQCVVGNMRIGLEDLISQSTAARIRGVTRQSILGLVQRGSLKMVVIGELGHHSKVTPLFVGCQSLLLWLFAKWRRDQVRELCCRYPLPRVRQLGRALIVARASDGQIKSAPDLTGACGFYYGFPWFYLPRFENRFGWTESN
jgi:hypothetical protein